METKTDITFEDMNLKDNLLRGIYAYGFEQPSNIQSLAIIPIINKNDIIAQAHSGTGKTGTFSISAIQIVDETENGIQIMIVCPTRELAEQIYDVCSDIGKFCNINYVLCIGGINMDRKQCDMLDNKPTIVIGTPGKIIDMIYNKVFYMDKIRMLIVDEADEMLSYSFENQMKVLISSIPKSAQICLFSATMPREILEITKKFMNNPKIILVKQENITLDGIKQYYVNVNYDKYKYGLLCDIYGKISINQSIIYVNTKSKADKLKKMLEEDRFSVSVIHSDMKPNERNIVMKDFRAGISRILLSTDLLSRGIDVQQVSIVINYDLPNNKECYIHRIGRSGRYGRKGVAINLTTNDDYWKIGELKDYYDTIIDEMPNNFDTFV
jgi:translation initiation factor 4A